MTICRLEIILPAGRHPDLAFGWRNSHIQPIFLGVRIHAPAHKAATGRDLVLPLRVHFLAAYAKTVPARYLTRENRPNLAFRESKAAARYSVLRSLGLQFLRSVPINPRTLSELPGDTTAENLTQAERRAVSIGQFELARSRLLLSPILCLIRFQVSSVIDSRPLWSLAANSESNWQLSFPLPPLPTMIARSGNERWAKR